jgi:hypothetical protein
MNRISSIESQSRHYDAQGQWSLEVLPELNKSARPAAARASAGPGTVAVIIIRVRYGETRNHS